MIIQNKYLEVTSGSILGGNLPIYGTSIAITSIISTFPSTVGKYGKLFIK
jgi:hypothetical protein